MASGGGKAKATSKWTAAMSVGAVEALKDQAGLCRWNHAFRSVQQRAGRGGLANGKGGAAPARPSSGGGAAAAAAAARRKAMREEEEEELRTVMYLSNWGPNN